MAISGIKTVEPSKRASGNINLLNEQNQPITIGNVIGWQFFFERSLKFWEYKVKSFAYTQTLTLIVCIYANVAVSLYQQKGNKQPIKNTKP